MSSGSKKKKSNAVLGVIMVACSLALLAVGFVLCIVSGQNNFISISVASLLCFAGAGFVYYNSGPKSFGITLSIAGMAIMVGLLCSVQTDVAMEKSGKVIRLAEFNKPYEGWEINSINPFCERALYYPNEMKISLYEGRSYVLMAVNNSYGERLYQAYGGDWEAIRDSVVYYVDHVYNSSKLALMDPGSNHPARWQIMRAHTLDELYRMQKELGLLPYVNITAWRLTE